MAKLKVLFVITDLGKGGAERYLLDLVEQIESHYPQIDYRIASLYENVQYDEFKNNPKVVFLNYQAFSLRSKAENAKYSQLLSDFKPDIVHSHRFLGEFITAYDVRPSIKYICHGHDNMIQFKPLSLSNGLTKETILQHLELRFLKKKKYAKAPTWFVANSKNTFEFYSTVLPKKLRKNVELIPLGFNYSKFFDPKAFEQRSSPIRLINVGSFQAKKNQKFAVDIALELKNRGCDFEFKLIGDGTEFENVQAKVKDYSLSEKIKFLGLQSEVEKLYKEADIYVHTATYEPFGLVLLEAMAAGLPVVTLNGEGNKDIINDGTNGFIIDDQNPSLFADKIIALSTNKELYQSISTNGQKLAKQFSIELKTKELVDFYKKITGIED